MRLIWLGKDCIVYSALVFQGYMKNRRVIGISEPVKDYVEFSDCKQPLF